MELPLFLRAADNLLEDWRRTLVIKNLAPRTIVSYVQVGRALFAWMAAQPDCPHSPEGVTPRHVEGYMVYMLNRPRRDHKEGQPVKQGEAVVNAAKHFRSLQQLFNWADAEGIIDQPMRRMSPPAMPEQPVPVIPEAHLVKLIAVCEQGSVRSRSFERVRDAAIIRLFLDAGARLDEVASLALGDLDFDMDIANVLGKGRRPRGVPFGGKTAEALRRYLRKRAAHPYGMLHQNDTDVLWVGKRGPLTNSGIDQMIDRRCAEVGIEPINPHRFRHTWATDMKDAGADDSDLMRLAGWRSRTMVARYAGTTADKRAREVHRKLQRGDRF